MSSEDRVSVGLWGMDPSTLQVLRLSKTQEAFQNRDLVTAVIEAEELLDEDPENVDALSVLGDAELELGHGRESTLIFERLHRLDPKRADYLSGLAMARFLDTDFEGALDSARQALAIEKTCAEAYAFAGLSLQRLGRSREAEICLKRAYKLEPESYPPPVPSAKVPWKRLLKRAIESLPATFQDFYHQVPVVFHTWPDVSVLRSVEPPINPMVLALYEGEPPDEPPEENAEEPVLPRSVRVYQGNACCFAQDLERLTEDLASALESEARDWLGVFDDEDPNTGDDPSLDPTDDDPLESDPPSEKESEDW